MVSTRFKQQHIIEYHENPASSVLMNEELQNIYRGTNELDKEAETHRAKQADSSLADTAGEKHVTNAQTKKWEDTANDVVSVATPNKILRLNGEGALPADVTGNASTATKANSAESVEWTGISWKPSTFNPAPHDATHDTHNDGRYQTLSAKGQPGGYAGLDEGGKVSPDQLPSTGVSLGLVIALS